MLGTIQHVFGFLAGELAGQCKVFIEQFKGTCVVESGLEFAKLGTCCPIRQVVRVAQRAHGVQALGVSQVKSQYATRQSGIEVSIHIQHRQVAAADAQILPVQIVFGFFGGDCGGQCGARGLIAIHDPVQAYAVCFAVAAGDEFQPAGDAYGAFIF